MDWLNYHHLYYFWVVAKERSFTRAAQRLKISQSAVSHQISQLEDFLGTPLMLRSTSRPLTLTEEGQVVLSQAEDIFNQGNDLVAGIRQGALQSMLKIGAFGSLSKNLQVRLLKPAISNPKFTLEVEVGDSQSLLTRLQSYQLDAILCDVHYPHSEEAPLLQREIARERICLVARPLKTERLNLHQRIEKHGIYLPSKSNPVTTEILAHLKSQNINAKVRGYIDDIALLRLLAVETDATIVVPRVGVERDLRAKGLVVLHEFKSLYQRFYLVLRQRGHRSQKILMLLEQNERH